MAMRLDFPGAAPEGPIADGPGGRTLGGCIEAVRKRKTVEPLRAQLSFDAIGKRPVDRAAIDSSQIGCSNDLLIEDDDDDDEDRDRQCGVEDPEYFMDEPAHER
jgi:hypothetical protein